MYFFAHQLCIWSAGLRWKYNILLFSVSSTSPHLRKIKNLKLIIAFWIQNTRQLRKGANTWWLGVKILCLGTVLPSDSYLLNFQFTNITTFWSRTKYTHISFTCIIVNMYEILATRIQSNNNDNPQDTITLKCMVFYLLGKGQVIKLRIRMTSPFSVNIVVWLQNILWTLVNMTK